MKNHIILLLLFTLTCGLSCERDLNTESEMAIPGTVYSVSPNDVIEVAQNVCSKTVQRVRSDSEASSKNSILSLCDGETPFAFIVNYSDDGFVIISADRRMNPVLAYSEDGSIDTDSSNYPAGFSIWLDDIKSDFNSIQEGDYDEEIALKNSLMWDKILQRIESRSIPVDTSLPELVDTTVGPLLSTTWYQGAPFNNYLPPLNNASGFQVLSHRWAGSPTVTVARLLHFHQYPTTFSWSSMPLSISANDTTSYSSLFGLYYDVYSKINNFAGFYCDSLQTTVNEVFHLDTFLKTQYGFSSATQINYSPHINYSIVSDELLNHSRPVIFTGETNPSTWEREYWICDGVHEFEDVTYLENGHAVINGYLYFHESWMTYRFPPMWLGFGLFTAGYSHSTPISFSKKMRLVYQITP